MNENEEKITSLPEDNPQKQAEPTKAEAEGEKFIPIKYNKEILNLSFERAGELAQKGMKFEALSSELELLKELSHQSGKSVMQFLNSLRNEKTDLMRDSLIEKCGDDDLLITKVKALFQNQEKCDDGFDEVRKNFAEIKSREDLPQCVLENAKLNGRLLLDEFLRYRLQQENAVKENIASQQKAKLSSTGSQLNKSRGENPEAAEFLRGLWRKN